MGGTRRYLFEPGSDYWSVRQLKWIGAGIAVLSLVAGGAIWWHEHSPAHEAFFRYLDAVQEGRVDDAYGKLCAKAQQAMPDYGERLARIYDEIGRIKSIGETRGSSDRRGIAILRGTKKDFTASIPIVREEGHWRPCPEHGPLE